MGGRNPGPWPAFPGGLPAGGPGAGYDLFLGLLPYVQIALGLALVLGFFTTYAAIAAGLVLMAEPAAQTVALLAQGLPGGQRGPMLNLSIFTAMESSRVLLTAAVAWLAAGGDDALSLDSLVFVRRARQGPDAPEPGAAPTGRVEGQV
jgi:hypothetical protein